MTNAQRCPKCTGPMADGFVLDRGHSNASYVGTWVEGPPLPAPSLKGLFTDHLKGRQQWGIVGMRCATCGFVELYARDTYAI